MGTQQRARIVVARQKGYVYDVEDVQLLRVQHHICGLLTGSLPQVGQQNVFLGLPLLLLPEEVVLLVRNKLAVIVDDVRAHRNPTHDQAEAYHAMRAAAIDAQRADTVRLHQAKREKMAELFKDEIGKRKLVREQEQEQREAAVSQSVSTSTSMSSFEVVVPELESRTEAVIPPSPAPSPTKPLSSVAYTIVIQPSSTDAPWYDPAAASYEDLDAAEAAGVWNYPTTPLQEARCKVFEDLWRKGYFMGGGLRFGGDFLIYPGDPLRYHSHFTLTVIPSPSSPIMPLDLVAYGRLATAVKKAHLLGTWNEAANKAEYISLEWAAFG